MAVVPVSGSIVHLLKGVPFTNDYKNIRLFNNHSEAFGYFSNRPRVHSMTEVTFVENDGKTYVSVNASIDELREASYMMFQNTEYSTKWFYAFITKLVRKNTNTTYVYFELDTFQTWFYDASFKQSFVVREHCKLWNEDGSPVINTIDEGLNYGSEYDTVSSIHHVPNSGIRFLVIATQKAIHGTNKGQVLPSIVGVGQPFSYYLVPFVDSDVVVWATIQGERKRMSTLIDTLAGLYKDNDFTNNIATMFITEQTGLKSTSSKSGDTYEIVFNDENQVLEYAEGGEGAKMVYVSNAPKLVANSVDLGNKYDGYRNVTESKLLMYPYTSLTLDDMQGNRMDYKNEYITTSNIVLTAKGSMGTSNKTSYAVDNYNMNSSNDLKQWLNNEFAIQNINPNDVSILTSMISSFIQSNKNTLINQKDQIMFQGYSSLGSSLLGNAQGMAQGGRQGYMSGADATMGIVKGAGNTVLQLQGIEAKIDDIRNVPPQINKMGTNTSYDVGNGYIGTFLIKKQIKPEYQKKLEDFFKAYGYKVNELKYPNLRTRQNWNYVETKSCNITGDFNSEDLNDLKNIFDNGVTLWHNNDVGNYDKMNGVI